MKIGVIGSGNVGTALAKRLVPKGHAVLLSYSRDARKLESTARSLGATSGSPSDAVRFGEVLALTVPWAQAKVALSAAGAMSGHILWDCTNALKPDMSGLAIGTTTSAGEIVQRLAAGARVVKGIPPFAELLHSSDPTINGTPATSFICGDDADAKAVVRELLTALPATVIDAGPLESSRYVEPAAYLLVRLAYFLGRGPRIGLELMATH